MGAASLEGDAVNDLRFTIYDLRFLWTFVVVALVHNFGACWASETADPNIERPTVIVVVGAAGTPEYGVQFIKWAQLWEQACTKGGEKFISIGLNSEVQNTDDRTILQQTITDETQQTDAALWLVLIGHGTFDGRTAKFNLQGPDLSAKDLAEWLGTIVRPLVVINTSSSSAPFLSILSGRQRVVITATKSGYEQNYTRFGGYLAEAIAEPRADLDKDGQTSLLEAFLTASHRVDEFYSAEGRLATERAILDDNGDGLGTRADWFRGIRPVQSAEDGASLDGYRAHQFHLVRSEAENAMPLELRAKRDKLELEVLALRDSKDKYSEEEYFSRLEKMLYEIAQIYEQSEQAENRPG